jgi:uncharacterized protein with von Willebrand factor type A (vWA) domain
MSSPTVVAVDISLRLPMQGLWDCCIQTALMTVESIRIRQGLTPLIIGFNESARWLSLSELANLEYESVYGTNVQHALSMARFALDGASGTRRILFVAEIEPSAHCDAGGKVYFDSPPSPETRQTTLNEARACAIAGIRVDFLLLTSDSELGPLAAEVAAECGGSVTALSEAMPMADGIENLLDGIGMS